MSTTNGHRRRISRNHFEPVEVLEFVEKNVDAFPDGVAHEAFRLLEEAAHAYMMLRADTRELAKLQLRGSKFLTDKSVMRRAWGSAR